jgi:phosphoribosylaminoimidazolecarboxamide formyltransferase/IMP cyclohydrolase
MRKRALISVSDKTGIVDFAKELVRHGFEVVSTGGTYTLLTDNGVEVIGISDVTEFPEILGGRVKTLHPAVHGGLLAIRSNSEHMNTLEELAIKPIDLVVVNLYPFQSVIEKPDCTFNDAIENIDIGGPTMVRASAKNHKYVTIVVDPGDYVKILNELEAGDVTLETREELAAKAFRHTAAYDALISSYLTKEEFPDKLTITYNKKQDLRYGENPHQKAALYEELLPNNGVINAKQIHGKELSYNNIGDADVALEMVKEFERPACVAIKHMNPCGVGIGDSPLSAYERAYEGDPVSIFGGIVSFNREVDASCAKKMLEIFLEVIIAPSYSEEALEILTEKKNLRLLIADTTCKNSGNQLTSVGGGLLIQEEDKGVVNPENLSIPTKRKPTKEEEEVALFAWTVAKYVKSNAIVVAKDNRTLGIGPGQTNRVGAAKIAIEGAGDEAVGAILASDAFFPMPDTVEAAAKAGIAVIIQPGGSIKDELSIAACDKHNIAMIFTGMRHFRH